MAPNAMIYLASLQALPMELLKIIIDDDLVKSWNDTRWLLQIQTLCKSLEALTHVCFSQIYFSQVTCFFLDPERLRVLKGITSLSDLVIATTRVILTLTPLNYKSDSDSHDQALNDHYTKYLNQALDRNLVISILEDLSSVRRASGMSRAKLFLDLQQWEIRTGQQICPAQEMLDTILTSGYPLDNLLCTDKFTSSAEHLMRFWQCTSHSTRRNCVKAVDYIADVASLTQRDVVDEGRSLLKHEIRCHRAIYTILKQSGNLRSLKLRANLETRPVQAFDALPCVMLRAVRLTSLRMLVLSRIVCDPDDLIDTLVVHKSTLRKLQLSRVTASTYSWNWRQLLLTLLEFSLKSIRLNRLRRFCDNTSDVVITACFEGPSSSSWNCQIKSTKIIRESSGESMYHTLLKTSQRVIQYDDLDMYWPEEGHRRN